MELLAVRAAVRLEFIPFATSIVLVMGAPEAKPSQPRALAGGHVLSAAVGLLVVTLVGPQPWAAAVAVGLAMIVMHATDTFHPPAGINPLLVVINDRSWSFLFIPVASGVAILIAFAFLWHNSARRGSWPETWW
jgi:CBS-domain-containing membrane protein